MFNLGKIMSQPTETDITAGQAIYHPHIPNAVTQTALRHATQGKHFENTSLNKLRKDWLKAIVKPRQFITV